jgi:hypothetical protein
MTDTPRPIDPEHVDELLSADLDGELADAAADFGYDVDDVRAQLAADAELRARRDALDNARRELAVVRPLDEVTAARLRSAAREELRPAKRTRLYAISGGIAAALVLVVGVVAVASNHSSNNGAKTEASANVAAPPTRPAAHVPAAVTGTDFGTASNVDALVTRVEHARSQATEAAPKQNMHDSTSLSIAATALDGKASSGALTTPFACSLASKNVAGTSAQLVEQGTATVAGQPVSVWVYDRTGAPQLLVVLGSDCKLVAARPLGTTSP